MAGKIIMLNSPFKFREGRLRKNGTRGRGRYTIEIESEPILFDLDDRNLGKPVADAIRELIRKQIKGINETAAPLTLKQREKALRSFNAGARWATRRFAGGRIGAKPPQPQITTKFNNSGRLADGLHTRLNRDGSYTTNVPANRLRRDEFSAGHFENMLIDFRRLVPALDPRRAGADPSIRAAVLEGAKLHVTVAKDELAAKRKQLQIERRKLALQIYRSGVGFLAS